MKIDDTIVTFYALLACSMTNFKNKIFLNIVYYTIKKNIMIVQSGHIIYLFGVSLSKYCFAYS